MRAVMRAVMLAGMHNAMHDAMRDVMRVAKRGVQCKAQRHADVIRGALHCRYLDLEANRFSASEEEAIALALLQRAGGRCALRTYRRTLALTPALTLT